MSLHRFSKIADGMAPGSIRLAAFVGLSIVLHLLTVIGTGPLDFAAMRPGSAPARTELHATLVTGDAATRSGAPGPEAEKASAMGAMPAPAPDSPAPAEADGVKRGIALPSPDKWYTASEVDVRAEPITDIRLRYPAELKERIVGKVRVRVFIDEGGVVRKLQIAESQPQGVFDEAAKQAWEDVRFSPARRNGIAVKSQKLIELNYAPSGGL